MNDAGSFVLPFTREFYFWLGSKSTRCRGAAFRFGNGVRGNRETIVEGENEMAAARGIEPRPLANKDSSSQLLTFFYLLLTLLGTGLCMLRLANAGSFPEVEPK